MLFLTSVVLENKKQVNGKTFFKKKTEIKLIKSLKEVGRFCLKLSFNFFTKCIITHEV